MAAKLRLDRFVPYLLSVASNRVSDRIAGAYAVLFGITIPEWRLLALIAEVPALTQVELGERTRMDKVTVSRAAIALVNRGLVARAPNAHDRRSHRLSLTGEGRALYEQVAPKALDMEARMLASFAPEEVEQFIALLHRIDAAAQEGEEPAR